MDKVEVAVKTTLPPSSTLSTSGVIEYIGATSPMVTSELVTIPGPDVDPVRTTILKVSSPSRTASVAIDLTIVQIQVVAPVLTTLKEPVVELLEKSSAVAVPPVL